MKEKKPRLRRSVSYSRYGYYFILPFFIVYAVFSLWPLISTFYYSLFEYTTRNLKETVSYTGLTNYKKLLGFVDGETPYFLKYLGNTVRIWFFNFVPQILLSLLLAAWLTAKIQHCSFASFWDCVSLSSALLFAMLYSGEGRTELGVGKVIDEGFLTAAFPFLFLEQKLGVNLEYRLIVYRLQCLACFVLYLVLLLSRKKTKTEGILALRYWAVFASMQIFWESLRDDGHMLFIFLRIGQVAAGVVLVCVLLTLSRRFHQNGQYMPWFVWLIFSLCLGMIAALEFSLDGRLSIGTPSMVRDYGLMVIVCIILAALPCVLTGRLETCHSK